MESINVCTIEKWKFLKKYLNAYTTIVSCHFPKFTYIDALAGEGKYGNYLGSPSIALELKYPFTDYVFVEKRSSIISILKNNLKRYSKLKASIYRKDNKASSKQINIDFKNISAEEFIKKHLSKIQDYPCFIFLDPYGIEELSMDIVSECAKKKKVELMINFSVSGVMRNVGLPRCHELITKYYGSDEWKKIPSKAVNRGNLYSDLYIKTLKKYFDHVINKPIKNENNSPLYHLIFATNNKNGDKIMKAVMEIRDEQKGLGSFINQQDGTKQG